MQSSGSSLGKFGYLIIIGLALIALWPFFKKGYFESHDGEWMVIRFSAFHQTLTAGQFPVRFVDRLNNNYGYPVVNFLYPLPFYLAEIPKVVGFGFVDSIKIVFILSTVASVVTMYWALSCVFDKYSSFAGAISYLYVPYRFVDLYIRGSLGENLAFVFPPLILGCIIKIAKGKKIYLPLSSIFIGALIISHNVVAFLFTPFLFVLAIFSAKGKILEILSSFILGVLLASFFWIPALYDLQFVRLSQIKVSEIADHLVSPLKLIFPSWGYGPTPNGLDPLPIFIGIVPTVVFTSTIILRFLKKINNKVVDFLIVVTILIIFLTTTYASFAWETIPIIDVIQFPWRIFSILVFIGSFLTAYLINMAKSRRLLMLLILFATIAQTFVYTKPRVFVNRGDSFYTTNEDTTNVRDEYLPLWVKEKPTSRASQKLEIIEGKARIEFTKVKPINYQAVVDVQEESIVRLNTIYFPGLTIKSEGSRIPFDYQNKFGLPQFKLSKGRHEIIIDFAETPISLVSDLISLAAFLITGVLLYKLWRKQNL